MKQIIIIFSILCLTAVGRADETDPDVWLEECAQELNISNVEHFQKRINWDAYIENPTDNVTCAFSCALRKVAIANGTTLYKGLLATIDTVYDALRLDDHNDGSGMTRSQIKSKIDECYAKGLEECEFVKCADLTKTPLVQIFYLIKKLAEAVGQAIGIRLREVLSLG